MPRRNNLAPNLGLLALTVVAGCGAPPGPTTTVHGSVTIAGAPLGQAGWLVFYPQTHTVGDPGFARIAADGRFSAADVPIGRVQVRIKLAAPEKLPQVAWKRTSEVLGIGSELNLEAPPQGRRFDLDLAAP